MFQTVKPRALKADIAFPESSAFKLMIVEPTIEKGPLSERGFTQHRNISPNINTPYGGGSVGSRGEDREYEGVADWTFDGRRNAQIAKWRWKRGDHYNVARGSSQIVTAVVAKDHPSTKFHGTATMEIVPEKFRFWRQGKRVFDIPFEPPNPPSSRDLSEEVGNVKNIVGRVVA